MSNFYELLDVSENATAEEIKKAYKQKSLIHHPDKNNGSEESKEEFIEIKNAYETLIDPEKRRLYDEQIGISQINEESKKENAFKFNVGHLIVLILVMFGGMWLYRRFANSRA